MNPWLIQLIGLVVGVVSPKIHTGLTELLDKLETMAKETENPYDNILVAMLRDIMTSK